jgi:5-methylthioadenosine/S-adenosylhomocysteine deaminase
MSSRTLLRPRWVYLGSGRLRDDLDVLVEDGVIAGLPTKAEAATIDAEVVELPDRLLLPGLMNLHTHAGAGPVGRAVGEDYELPTGMPFYVPLSRLWRFAYQEEFREKFRSVMRWDVLSMMATGTTTILNHASTDIDGYLDIAADLGVRTWTGPTIPLDVTHRLGQLEGKDAHRPDLTSHDGQQAELRTMEALFENHDRSHGDRIRILLGPAAVHTDDFSVLQAVAEMARRFDDCLVTTHLCQAPSELAETDRKYGKTPLRVLEDAGLLNERLLGAHGTYLPDEDRQAAADSGMTIVHCCSRKAKEALVSPYVSFQRSGIRVALGTDGFNPDMVEELKLAAMLGKVATGETHSPTAVEVVDAATSGAAASLGRSDLGVIAVGARADLIAIRSADSMMAPIFDPLQTLVYYGNGRDVDLVMIDGDITVRDGAFVGVDMVAARQEAEATLVSIWESAIDAGLLAEVLPSTTRPETTEPEKTEPAHA